MPYQTKRGFVNAAKSLLLATAFFLSGNVYAGSYSTYPYVQSRENLPPFNEKILSRFLIEKEQKEQNVTNNIILAEQNSETDLESSLRYYHAIEKSTKSELEKTLKIASTRINDIFYDKNLSDLDFRFNFDGESDYYWSSKTLNRKGASIVRQGLEDALEQTTIYKNAQDALSDAIQATFAPTFNFLGKIFGKRFADGLNATVGLDLGTDPFKDPYIRDSNSRYDFELRSDSLRISAGGGNALKFNLKPNGLGILYKEEVGQGFYFITGAEITGGMKIEELDFNFKENKWEAHFGVEGNIGKGWRTLIKYSANYYFPESSDSRHGNEQKVVALFSNSF